ncbi:hypothetical protein JBF11_06830 [Taurinivorans muris]|uniref:Uncharacterized protein n=1 Tax=Taurinivorans muris TaxID=2787751 RepID=A0ABY5XZ63_9BACT|nr:hypothetical protein JBF11_06830 [Desulfovibrionaceae bacterium LT0009]
MDDFVTEDNKKREDLKNLLFELSASFIEKNNLSVYYKRLENIYLNNNITNDSCKEYQFRHYYSDIYSTFYRIIKERDENSIINLICNIGLLKDSYLKYKENISSQNRIQRNIYKNLVKLFDHINLEYARYAENDLSLNALEKGRKEINELKNEYEEKKENIEKLQDNLTNLTKQYDNEKKNIGKLQNTLKELTLQNDKELKKVTRLKSKIEGFQKEYVGILSIFAAVIVAFTAGTTFSSSILNNIDNVSIYRLVFTCLLLGCVLINVLYILFSFVLTIIKGNSLDIRTCLLPNIIIILLLFFTIKAWCNGVVETRNERFIKENPKTNKIEVDLKLDNMPLTPTIKEKIEAVTEGKEISKSD